jgi:protein-L-isoaspartate(D-aspartate) O-methyltransferase
LTDTALANESRLALVRKLRRDGTLPSGRIERAFRRVPRHVFVPEVDLDIVYRDTNIPTRLEGGEVVSASSQPAIMAIMLTQLAARPDDNVLEVGAGTGYNAALLAEIVGERGQVTAIDLDQENVDRSRSALASAGYSHVRVERADGISGFADSAPYDRIIATVGMGDVPRAWLAQLKPGGRLVLPLSMRGIMRSVAFRKDARAHLLSTSIRPAQFMPFRGAQPLGIRELRVGPELGLSAWLPADRQPVPDLAELFDVLQSSFEDLTTRITLSSSAFVAGLNLWVRAHQPEVIAIHAEGALSESGPVPRFVRNPFVWAGALDRLSLGLWSGRELALLGRPEDIESPGDDFPLLVRAFGGKRLAERLIGCIENWQSAGSPTDEHVQLRLVPEGQARRSAASIPMQAGRLEVTWGSGSSD